MASVTAIVLPLACSQPLDTANLAISASKDFGQRQGRRGIVKLFDRGHFGDVLQVLHVSIWLRLVAIQLAKSAASALQTAPAPNYIS